MLRLRVLGALDATIQAGGTTGVLDLGGPRQRSVLALLLVARGQVVSVDRLIEDLWNGEPPRRAIGALQAYVSHLRRSLEPGRAPRTPAKVLVSEPPGYAIRLPPEALDAWRFEALVRQAADPAHTDTAPDLLQEALNLWRGQAYGEFAGESWAAPEAARLDGLRITTRERWCEATLRRGDAQEAVLAAESLTREYPLREEGWRLLAMGLYAGGRQADALTALRRARDLLADELGIDPGPALLQVEADVLHQRLEIPILRPSSRSTSSTPAQAVDRLPAQVEPTGAQARPQAGAPAGTAGSPPVTWRDESDFVGRESDLKSLHTLATQALAGPERRVALIAGEPGAGKSRLVGRFAQELAAGSWRVVLGRCPESDGAPPGWGWVEVVRALAAEVDPGALSTALAPLLEDSWEAAGDWDASFGRFLLSRALTDYLDAAAGDRPLAVILDDLHRGDAETLTLLESAATGSAGVPLLLIATYRPLEVQPALRDTLAALAPLPPTRVTLAGLDAAESAKLIHSVAGVQPDAGTLAALLERTGGNPFYLTESARLLGSEGGLVATSQVPEGVRDVLRRRLARLPELTVSVLRLAAVIGRDIDIDVLIGAAEVDEDAVLDALEAGVLAGLLSEPGTGSIRFAHVLVKDTLYDDAPRLRRGRWHARVAAAVARVHPDDAAALAHHYHRAGTAATARQAVDAAVRAAEQAAARYAHDTAAGLFGQALADLDRVPPDVTGPDRLTQQVQLLARQSSSHLAAGAGVAAKQTREQAVRLADRADRIDLLIVALAAWDVPTPWLNRTYGVVDPTVVPLIDKVLSSTDPLVTPAVRSRMLCALVAEVAGEQPDRALVAAREALAIAREVGDPVLLGLALHAACSVVTPELDAEQRLAIGRELLELGQRPGLAVFALIGHHSMIQVYGATGDHRRMIVHVEALEDLVATYRWRQAEGIAGMHRGLILHLTGRLDEAEAMYAAAADTIRSSGALDAGGIIMLAFLTIRLTQGRAGELAAMGRDVDSRATDVMAELLALVVLQDGQPLEQVRLLRGPVRPVRHDFFRCLFLALRGMLVTGLADEREAAELYPELSLFRGQIAGGGTGSYAAGPVDTVLGDLCVLLGRTGDADAHYRVALELAGRCGNEPWVEQAADRLAVLADPERSLAID